MNSIYDELRAAILDEYETLAAALHPEVFAR